MAKIEVDKELFTSSFAIFFMYVVVSGLAIMGFRFFLPAEPVPLAYFSSSWKLIEGFLEYIAYFPALALTSLVIPFGFKIYPIEENKRFSPDFLKSLNGSIFTAIIATVIYGLLFSIALPIARNYEANILFRSQLYNLARARAEENSRDGKWVETSQFIDICERIWPEGPLIAKLKFETDIEIEKGRFVYVSLPETASVPAGTPEPVNATEAMDLAETAFAERRYFDAHWLATLSARLAGDGTLDEARATRLAGMAWTEVNSLAPNADETVAFRNYRLKREGYEALVGGEWIRAYYIFLELVGLTPDDPDAARYFALSENGLKNVAFFSDEVSLNLETTLSGTVGVVLSTPLDYGRVVLRLNSLSVFSDVAYGIETEIMAFDLNGRPLWSMEVPYTKILPLTLDPGQSLSILLRALDRAGKAEPKEPKITVFGQSFPNNSEIVLPVSWDTFLLLSNLHRGLSALSPLELRAAAANLATCGYLPEVFESELLQRFVKPLFLLPLGIFAVALGWRYRAVKRARFIAIPMLGVLPVVFNGAVYFGRGWLNDLGILSIITYGFNTTAIIFGAGIVVLFILSLILLAANHD
ncbi:MAG: hypothetical protein LBQ94_07915 [Treponema sp.]|jgi:hypothetical protein|nr:hypothetical protein [Treponema sp.]